VKILRACQSRAEVYLHSLTHLWTVDLGCKGSLANRLFNGARLVRVETSLRFCVVVTSMVVAEINVHMNFITLVYLREVLSVVQVGRLATR
jgi:hypothetical protein